MIPEFADYDYYIAEDNFNIYFPEDTDVYDIDILKEWYEVIPTEPKIIGYYGDNIEILKQHFERFMQNGNIKTKVGNDIHGNKVLNVKVYVIYKAEKLVGFAAQEWNREKKILYFMN